LCVCQRVNEITSVAKSKTWEMSEKSGVAAEILPSDIGVSLKAQFECVVQRF